MADRTARPRSLGDAHPAAEPLHRGALQLLRLLRREDAASGISPARLSALSVLVFGGPSTLGALATAEGVSAPTMSRLVAELERDGWIRRTADPADARASRLAASAAARRLLLSGRARRLGALSTGLRALTRADQRAVGDALPALERLVRALATGSARVTTRSARRRFD
jgi:DNA-binding MarR family transcriptional regulator